MNMEKKLLVFGASGHAKDVISTAKSLGYGTFQLVTTDGSSNLNEFDALKESALNPAEFRDWDCIAAIGNNQHRQRFFERYQAELNFVSILSPLAWVAPSATIGKGTYLGAFASIGPDTSIGIACIINNHSIVGHDAKVGDLSQLGPRVCLSGHVELGQSVFVGAGASFNNGSYEEPLIVADRVYIGMGCLITQSIRQSGIRLIPKPNYIAVKGE